MTGRGSGEGSWVSLLMFCRVEDKSFRVIFNTNADHTVMEIEQGVGE